jgi:hypothetical protein
VSQSGSTPHERCIKPTASSALGSCTLLRRRARSLLFVLGDVNKASPEKLKALGAAGVVVVGDGIQAILGTQSETRWSFHLQNVRLWADTPTSPANCFALRPLSFQPDCSPRKSAS